MNAQKVESATELLTSFQIGDDFFGIEVMKVQEVTGELFVIPVPLAPNFVRGLINLRGQLATALGLRELFGIQNELPTQQMSVVCRMDGNLVSLIVDSIGEVVEVHRKDYESCPETMPATVKPYIKGIYKMHNSFLSLLDLEKIAKELSPASDKIDIKTKQQENE